MNRTAGVPLAQLRRRVPWTQRELAAAAGVSVGTVRGIERGRHRAPRPRVIRALAAALGVAPAAVAEFHSGLGLAPAAPPSAGGIRPRRPPRPARVSPRWAPPRWPPPRWGIAIAVPGKVPRSRPLDER